MSEIDMCLVSVQWGSGPHYFITPKPISFDRATGMAASHATAIQRRLGRIGALPKVRVLRIAQIHEITRSKKLL